MSVHVIVIGCVGGTAIAVCVTFVTPSRESDALLGRIAETDGMSPKWEGRVGST